MPTSGADCSRDHWIERLGSFVPGFMAGHGVLADCIDDGSVFFHGSMADGMGDEFADLDLWLFVSDDRIAGTDAAAGTRFFEFECDGVIGHFNVEPVADFSERVDRCDMDCIYQLRRGAVLFDPTGAAHSLEAAAREPMRAEVRDALFRYHYVEMCSEHRSCVGPIQRGDSVAFLLAIPKALAHAYRAALVLSAEPYPYDKWLDHAARCTPIGALIGAEVDTILDLCEGGALKLRVARRLHPIYQRLRAMRDILRDAARERGVDGEWLDRWWLYMTQVREAVRTMRWSESAP